MNEIRRNVPVDEQIEILRRGVVDLVTEDDLRRKLATGKPLRVKLGADPTRPDLHLGHAVILRKMRQFQDLGHKVIMLIGDFTAMIGDPSGKSKTRPPLTLEETRANAHSYLEQCRLILRGEPDVLEIRYNGEWLEPMGYADVIRLASKYTVARILERDDFTKRLQAQTPISLHELLYPVTQGYDSVALEADVELGGTDQLFNNLVGRALQRDYGQEAQVVMTLPLLVGLDGTEKMSKSLDNYIGLTDEPHVMFAKLMKVPDALLENYFTLLTDLSSQAIKDLLNGPPASSHQVLASLVTGYLYNGIEPNLESLTKSAPALYYSAFKSSLDEKTKYEDAARNLRYTLSDLNSMSNKLKSLLSLAESYNIIIKHDDIKEMHDSIEKLDQGTSKGNEAMKMLEEAERADPNKFPYDFAIENILSFQNTIIDVKMKEKVSHVLEGLTKSIFDVLEENRKTLDYIESANIINDSLNRYRKVARGGIPDNIPVINIAADLNDSIDADRISMAKLVVLAGLEPSNGAARKLIQNRGLKLNGETYTDPQGQLTRAELAAEGGAVIQKGKDKFARLVLES